MISEYAAFLKDWLVWIWQPTEPLIQIFTAFAVLRILLSLNNRLVGVWEGELRNDDDYTLKATISFFKKNGETHSWIYYTGKGHDGLKTQGVDKTILFAPTFTDVGSIENMSSNMSSRILRWFKSPWTPRRFVLNCQREMLGMTRKPFVIPHVRRRYSYSFAFDSMTSKHLKCEVSFRDKDENEVKIKGQFVKVR